MRAQRIGRVVMVSGLMLLPAVAWAQSATTGAIAGEVRDATGAVLPGATVEAASTALIEKVRTSVDSSEELQFCRQTLPLAGTTQVKFSGIYPLPWALQASATLQSVPGPAILASHVASNAEILPSLGRNLGQCGRSATCNGTATIPNLLAPNTAFEDRYNQLDVRLTKFVRMGRVRVRANFDVTSQA